MARFDDGELYVELEDATHEQAQRALVTARRLIASVGIGVVDAIRAAGKRETVLEKEIAWEAGNGPEPEWLTDEENECADVAEEAESAALASANADSGKLGLLDLPPEQTPVVRDLFECLT